MLKFSLSIIQFDDIDFTHSTVKDLSHIRSANKVTGKDVWGHLKQKLYTSMPSTPQEVMNTFLSLWNELRTQYAESLVFSIYNRMDNIIQTNGLRH